MSATDNGTLVMSRGEARTLNLTFTLGGIAENLTGDALRCIAKTNPTDPDAAAIFNKTIGSGITITNAAGGLADVAVDAADTTSLPVTGAKLYLEIWHKTAAGAPTMAGYARLMVQTPLAQAP